MILDVFRRVRKVAKTIGSWDKIAHFQRSFSQEGEDLILLRYFDHRRDGFYVDVGAHHPHRFSNTQLLYELGWSGINIDAMPGSMQPFRRHRRRDRNLEIGVGAEPGTALFHVFPEKALNTFDVETARLHAMDKCAVERTIDVTIAPLAHILGEHMPAGRTIDVMTIDVEGRDVEVLQSNDWQRFRPTIVLAEALGTTIDDLGNNPVALFMRERGYTMLAKTINTVFFVDEEQK